MEDEEVTKNTRKLLPFLHLIIGLRNSWKTKKGLWKRNWNNKKNLQTTTRVTTHMKKEHKKKDRKLLPFD